LATPGNIVFWLSKSYINKLEFLKKILAMQNWRFSGPFLLKKVEKKNFKKSEKNLKN